MGRKARTNHHAPAPRPTAPQNFNESTASDENSRLSDLLNGTREMRLDAMTTIINLPTNDPKAVQALVSRPKKYPVYRQLLDLLGSSIEDRDIFNMCCNALANIIPTITPEARLQLDVLYKMVEHGLNKYPYNPNIYNLISTCATSSDLFSMRCLRHKPVSEINPDEPSLIIQLANAISPYVNTSDDSIRITAAQTMCSILEVFQFSPESCVACAQEIARLPKEMVSLYNVAEIFQQIFNSVTFEQLSTMPIEALCHKAVPVSVCLLGAFSVSHQIVSKAIKIIYTGASSIDGEGNLTFAWAVLNRVLECIKDTKALHDLAVECSRCNLDESQTELREKLNNVQQKLQQADSSDMTLITRLERAVKGINVALERRIKYDNFRNTVSSICLILKRVANAFVAADNLELISKLNQMVNCNDVIKTCWTVMNCDTTINYIKDSNTNFMAETFEAENNYEENNNVIEPDAVMIDENCDAVTSSQMQNKMAQFMEDHIDRSAAIVCADCLCELIESASGVVINGTLCEEMFFTLQNTTADSVAIRAMLDIRAMYIKNVSELLTDVSQFIKCELSQEAESDAMANPCTCMTIPRKISVFVRLLTVSAHTLSDQTFKETPGTRVIALGMISNVLYQLAEIYVEILSYKPEVSTVKKSHQALQAIVKLVRLNPVFTDLVEAVKHLSTSLLQPYQERDVLPTNFMNVLSIVSNCCAALITISKYAWFSVEKSTFKVNNKSILNFLDTDDLQEFTASSLMAAMEIFSEFRTKQLLVGNLLDSLKDISNIIISIPQRFVKSEEFAEVQEVIPGWLQYISSWCK